MGGIKKTLTLEHQKKSVQKSVNQYRTVVAASLLVALFVIKAATLETFFEHALRIIALFLVFLFATSRYGHHRKTLKYINEELKKSEMQNVEDAKRRYRYKM